MPRLYSLIVKSSATTPFVPPPGGEGWHVTHAALAEGPSLINYATLSFKTSDDVWISLGTLQSTGRNFMSLDLPLTEYTEFKATGTSDIHITGTLAAMEDNDEADVDFDFDEEEDQAAAEQEILNAMMMNGRKGGRKAKMHKLMAEIPEEGDDTSSEDDEDDDDEEEPELEAMEEVESPKLHGDKPKAKAAAAAPAEDETPTSLSKSQKRKLKKKQRKEAKQAMASVSERQAKQQKVETPPPENPHVEKSQGSETAKMDPKKKRIRRFSNGFVIENLSYGNEEGQVVLPGKKVTIKYKGWLKDGKMFDENQGTGFSFCYGQGEVVKGLDKGLDDMRIGDKRKLTVPAKMGYGSHGAEPAVPPNADLTFEIELMNIE